MAIWGLGGLALCWVLLQSKLVPRIFSIWGLIRYTVFVVGTILELYGLPYGLYLSIPGMLFEVPVSLWLIARGFNPTALA
jgi:hypothetical protein